MRKKYHPHHLLLSMVGLLLNLAGGCAKFIDIKPPTTQLVTSSVFASDAAATAAMTGIYGNMSGSHGFAGQLTGSTSLLLGLYADELENFSTNQNQAAFYTNALSAANTDVSSDLWAQPYQDIYDANAVIEGLAGSSGVSDPVKNELTGEAKFIRAFCYFYLVNFFGEIPLITSTNYQANAVAARNTSAQVYDQIVTDLQDAQNLLPDDYSISDGERIRPNKAAASALLARVYLFTNDWTDAEAASNAVISDPLYSLPALDSVFLANSAEAIWQFKPVLPNINTTEGNIFILTTTPQFVALSNQVLQAFEPEDLRRTDWVDSITVGTNTYYYPFKYKVKTGTTLTEYSMVLRLGEQYLIRAEARAKQGNVFGAQSDLNMIRQRAGLPPTADSTADELAVAILHERQVELFTEWGHRWFDLKRTDNADAVMEIVTPLKGGSWNTDFQLFPIPKSEILVDQQLTQNPGY
ncbi:MAG TPA: RagB/SusD family nutrient uptake outer membrane protein [Puia sp.]|nr:RagB/SusD family nutrient uptake outer membrane protein [Puia sp.]